MDRAGVRSYSLVQRGEYHVASGGFYNRYCRESRMFGLWSAPAHYQHWYTSSLRHLVLFIQQLWEETPFFLFLAFASFPAEEIQWLSVYEPIS
jgi:hypothetical protein